MRKSEISGEGIGARRGGVFTVMSLYINIHDTRKFHLSLEGPLRCFFHLLVRVGNTSVTARANFGIEFFLCTADHHPFVFISNFNSKVGSFTPPSFFFCILRIITPPFNLTPKKCINSPRTTPNSSQQTPSCILQQMVVCVQPARPCFLRALWGLWLKTMTCSCNPDLLASWVLL